MTIKKLAKLLPYFIVEKVFVGTNPDHATLAFTKDHVYAVKSAILMKTIDELTEQRDSEYETAKALRRVIDEMQSTVRALKAEVSVRDGILIGRQSTIDGLNETISDLRMAASDMLDTINECSRREAEDSKVLMQVVSQVKQWDTTPPAYRSSHLDMRQIATIVEDYLAAPESPVVTLRTPSIGTRVVSKNEETHTIDEAKMRAVHALIGCGDTWVLYIDVDAVEVAKYNQTIDDLTQKLDELKDFIREQGGCVDDRDNRIEQLMVLNEALRIDIELAHNLSRDHIAGQDRFIKGLKETLKLERIDHTAEVSAITNTLHDIIKGLKTELDARNTVIKDFKAIEQKETDRLHSDLARLSKIRDQLERIGKIAEHPAYDCFSTALDEITKIIQEE